MSVLIDYSSGAFAANKAQGVGTVTAGTGTYNLAVASYDSKSFAFGSQDGTGTNIQFTPDGTKMILLGIANDDFFEYSLSTAWDISTASYTSNNFDLGSLATNMYGAFFRSNGTKIYVVSIGAVVYQYSMSTAWDITTASYDSVSFSVSGQDGSPRDLWFKPDGTKMYVVGAENDNIYQYSLSTAWDVSSASYDSVALSVSSQDTTPISIYFNSDGTTFWLQGFGTNTVYQYALTTAWDLSTASYSSISFSTSTQTSFAFGMTFSSDGSKMYISDNSGDTVYQYSTGTATSLDISSGNYFNYTPSANTTFTFGNAPASGTAAGFALAVTGANVGAGYDIANASYDSVSFSVGSVDTTPVSLAFNNDGTKFYFLGDQNKKVYQYSCSTAYDLSTATKDTEEASVNTQVSSARGFNFNNDGTKFFVSCYTNDAIYEYDLSTAFDASTASYNNTSLNISVGSNGSHCMSSNGLYLYTIDEFDDVDRYTLSTAWDLSTATYSDTKDDLVETAEASPSGIFISPDGTKLFIGGYTGDVVTQSSLSTTYDITTASYDSISFSIASQDGVPYGLVFKPDGTKMYIAGLANSTIYQYTTGSSATATFSYPASVEWPSGTAPDAPAIGETDVLVFLTDDGGTSYQGFQAGDAMA